MVVLQTCGNEIVGTIHNGLSGDGMVHRQCSQIAVEVVGMVTVILLIVLVQIIQFIFSWVSNRIDKRLK